MLAPALHLTLLTVAPLMRVACDDWWIIGSASVALHGGKPVDVADVDMLTSEADARRLSAALGISPTPGRADGLFRSAVFTTWREPPLAVEIMGGFAIQSADGCDAVTLSSRVAVDIDGHTLYIPDRAELRALLHRFGRAKDLARAALLA